MKLLRVPCTGGVLPHHTGSRLLSNTPRRYHHELIASIELHPRSGCCHHWTVAIDRGTGVVFGEALSLFNSVWRVTAEDLANAPACVRQSRFPDLAASRTTVNGGILLELGLATDAFVRCMRIQCPDNVFCPEYTALLHWCWTGLYRHAQDRYRGLLEELRTHFRDWEQ